MYKKLLLFVFISMNTCSFLNAQTAIANEKDIEAVKSVVQNMFNAMKKGDTLALKQCFSSTAIFQTIVSKPYEVVVQNGSVQDFLISVAKQPVGSLDERIEFETVKTNKELAIVWTPYQFYYKDKYSHRGVNSFQLVQLKEGWKIQYLIDTRYK
jgi:hypothetical protein